jgi:hypothetical protein
MTIYCAKFASKHIITMHLLQHHRSTCRSPNVYPSPFSLGVEVGQPLLHVQYHRGTNRSIHFPYLSFGPVITFWDAVFPGFLEQLPVINSNQDRGVPRVSWGKIW